MESVQPATLTESVCEILKRNGYYVEQNVDLGLGLYNTPLRSEIVAHNSKRFPDGLAIKTYWQSVGGSADEKFPYMVMTIRECYPIPCVIVYAGEGYRENAIDWLIDQADGETLVAVLHAGEIEEWLKQNKR